MSQVRVVGVDHDKAAAMRRGFIDSMKRELSAQGAVVPPVKVRRVPSIPRTALGKAPLIKAYC
jgi:hypothetical protein